MYYVEIKHEGLKKLRVVRDRDPFICEQKAQLQLEKWEEIWQKRVERESKLADRESKQEEAAEKTKEAKEEIEKLSNLLLHTLSIDDKIDWEGIKDLHPFKESYPKKPGLNTVSAPPRKDEYRFRPHFGFLDKVFAKRKLNRIKEAEELFTREIAQWESTKKTIEESNKAKEEGFQSEVQDWEVRRTAYIDQQSKNNDEIDARRAEYYKKVPDSIIDYCELVLGNSKYPDYFPQNFDLDYKPQGEVLIVDYSLPNPESLPRLKEIKYIQARDEFVESFCSDAVLEKTYDSAVYQISLRTIHELFEADVIDAIKVIVFNGWVNSIDKATGHESNKCIMTVQTTKAEFMSVNLGSVDPRACFKSLKGIGSSKLHSITAVAPIMKIDREDKRIVSSYEVAKELDESTNIAAMDWEDFEHLIRELFEKEFSTAGGEVKVTRASRDGGVDAIAFDPDPIRGGKIVIQAKRYTATVGVSAVRDLFGTVMNEGATKGILVSTADYGPDAYSFAKDKPLTLLDGGNLLHLLAKHGHRAKIDLKQARELLNLRNKN